MQALLPFILFAFVAAVTPGPTNILVLTNSARYGLAAAMPIVLGGCTAAAGIVLLAGLGLGQWLAGHPTLQAFMSYAGIVWLSVMSWQIYRSEASSIEPAKLPASAKPLGGLGAAALQLVNPKTWMMALAVVSVFAGNGTDQRHSIVLLASLFFLISLPCLSLWALLGQGAIRLLRSAHHTAWFNKIMALLLLLSTWSTLLI